MKRPVLAVFDFDGTLTYHDTFLRFLLYAAGPLCWSFYLVILIPSAIRYFFSRLPRQDFKEKAATLFLKGKSEMEVKGLAEEFVQRKLPKHFRPDALKRLEWHRSQGHRCIVVSASPEIYLDIWGRGEGIEIIATKLELNGEGALTGRLEGLNCRGEEKVRRLKERLGPLDSFEIFAYGDSPGDHPLLEIADHPHYRRMPEF